MTLLVHVYFEVWDKDTLLDTGNLTCVLSLEKPDDWHDGINSLKNQVKEKYGKSKDSSIIFVNVSTVKWESK